MNLGLWETIGFFFTLALIAIIVWAIKSAIPHDAMADITNWVDHFAH